MVYRVDPLLFLVSMPMNMNMNAFDEIGKIDGMEGQ